MSAADHLNGKQLSMFLPVNELVDKFDKHDSYFDPADTSPRDQWERPAEQDTFANRKGEPLRDRKLRQIEERKADPVQRYGRAKYDLEAAYHRGELPPVGLQPGDEERGYRPLLDDGHHRLALHEKRQRETGVPVEVPVRWWY